MAKNYPEHASNERTFLAWIRTIMAIVSFGLVIARLGQIEAAMFVQIVLLVVGGIGIILAYYRMRSLKAQIDREDPDEDVSQTADVALVFLVLVLFIVFAWLVISGR
jgi:putative membrane protein